MASVLYMYMVENVELPHFDFRCFSVGLQLESAKM